MTICKEPGDEIPGLFCTDFYCETHKHEQTGSFLDIDGNSFYIPIEID
jgi:hypothetical protein